MSERPSRTAREGSLDAPTRHALRWKKPEFPDRAALEAELERVFEICHGCRRCFSLCNAFPVLFDHVDETPTGEASALRGVERARSLEIEGLARVVAIADQDLERENAEETSAVHRLRFELPAEARAAMRRAAPVAVGVDHPHYRHAVKLSAATIESLACDFE